jgi:hypothetical protein
LTGLCLISLTAEVHKEFIEFVVGLDDLSFGDGSVIEEFIDCSLDVPLGIGEVVDGLLLGGFGGGDEVL